MTEHKPGQKNGFIEGLSVVRQKLSHSAWLPNLEGEPGRMLRRTIEAEGSLSSGYVLMCALSAGIATLGLLQSSVAVVIGAMLISPLMSPIAALGFGFASLDGHRIKDATRVVAIGACIGIFTGMLLTFISPIHNATPEIIARTQPTLLDLVVALFSGLAGGYATVQQKGGTAIGVAIATALMPPLATVGYGLGVWRFDFAGGALLLFFTNLAAIAFSFALVARLSRAARPIKNVEFNLKYLLVGLAAFAALATPLGLTLVRITREASATLMARATLLTELGIVQTNIAQLEVAWPLFKTPTIDAVVIAPNFNPKAQLSIEKRLTEKLNQKPKVHLQQIIAADIPSQTKAMVEAALDRNAKGIAKDVPPFAQIQSIVPTQSLWVNRPERIVNIMPISLPEWTLADYQAVERAAVNSAGEWMVHVIPPLQTQLLIPFMSGEVEFSPTLKADVDSIFWALQRWGVKQVRLEAVSRPEKLGKNQSPDPQLSDLTRDRNQKLTDIFAQEGISVVTKAISEQSAQSTHAPHDVTGSDDVIKVHIYVPRPTQENAAAAP